VFFVFRLNSQAVASGVLLMPTYAAAG